MSRNTKNNSFLFSEPVQIIVKLTVRGDKIVRIRTKRMGIFPRGFSGVIGSIIKNFWKFQNFQNFFDFLCQEYVNIWTKGFATIFGKTVIGCFRVLQSRKFFDILLFQPKMNHY